MPTSDPTRPAGGEPGWVSVTIRFTLAHDGPEGRLEQLLVELGVTAGRYGASLWSTSVEPGDELTPRLPTVEPPRPGP
jgi:hypothetical protein